MEKSVSKEEILSRLYSHASNFWNMTDIDSLDPVIKMLIKGLVSELFNLSNEIENIKVRILDSIANTLIPNEFNSPQCSHGILNAYPVESSFMISDRDCFFLEKIPHETRKKGVNRIDFSPVGQYRLIRASILPF